MAKRVYIAKNPPAHASLCAGGVIACTAALRRKRASERVVSRVTKAAQILKLDNGVRTTRQIAEVVYGTAKPANMAYVRTVTRQRPGGTSRSAHDRAYVQSDAGREAQSRASAKWRVNNREKYLAQQREHAAGQRRRRAEKRTQPSMMGAQ